MDSETMTVPEVARRFGVNVETVRRWIREKKVAARMVRFGQPGYRIDMSEVERIGREMMTCHA